MLRGGKTANVIYSIHDINASSAAAPKHGDSINLRLKPFGSGNKTLTSESYFDIFYIGFFKTREEAEDFIYPGDSKYPYSGFNNSTVPPYYFASNATVRKYIDEADIRKDEIIHTNNTVPYENHLTYQGLTGNYVGDYKSSSFVLTAKAGSYTSDTGTIKFTQNDVNLSDFPYVKVGYTADSDYALSATEAISSGIIDLTGTNASSLTLYPFGKDDRTLSRDMSISLDYIGLFKTRAEAESYTYKGENADNMTDTHIIYTANLLDPASTATGTVYFVTSTSNTQTNYLNNGKSPDKPWSFEKLVKQAPKNCTVYFKRGDSFRYTSTFNTQASTVYTSYGYGNKPKFIASIDGCDSGLWSKTEKENVWVFKTVIKNTVDPESGDNTPDGDVGHIRITDKNGNTLWGIKVMKRNDSDLRYDHGDVYNGRTHIPAMSGVSVEGGLGLYNDLEFYHDYNTGKLYLYCADGNPGSIFASIEIADKGKAIGNHLSNTVVDNLYVTGTGSHGFGYGNVDNGTVTNCHLEWIGGSIQTLNFTPNATIPTRFGNAVESYGSAVNFTIANCFASNVYDCCWTVQNQGAATFKDVFMYDNVAEYSNSGLEVWQSGGTTDNLYLHDNYTLFGGYGWSHQRPNKDGNFFYGGTGIRTTKFTNCSVENNVNVLATSKGNLVSELGSTRYNFNHNIYILGEGKVYTVAPKDTEHGLAASGNIPYDYSNIQKTYALGTDAGSTFYFVDSDTFKIGDDPHEIFKVSDNPITDINLDTDFVLLRCGEIYDLNAEIFPKNTTNDTLYYSSTNPAVAVCNNDGRITASFPGTTTVTVLSVDSGVSASLKVQVISNIETTEVYSRLGEGKFITNMLFIGDSLFDGGNMIGKALEEDYYIESETIADKTMSLANADIDELLQGKKTSPEVVFLSLIQGDYESSTSIKTFKNALRDVILDVYKHIPSANVIIVIPPYTTNAANSLGLTLADYANAAVDVAADVYAGCANLYTKSENSLVLYDKSGNPGQLIGAYISDDLVPTKSGGELIAKDMMNILETLGSIQVQGGYSYKYRYRANDMVNDASGGSGIKFGGKYKDDTGIYLRFVPDGSQANGSDGVSFQIDFKDTDFKLKEYPVIKVYYRAKVADSAAKIDLNMGVLRGGSTKRLWGPSSGRIIYTKEGSLSSFTIDAATYFSGGEGIKNLSEADADTPIKFLRFKPYDNARPLNTNDYFDIESIAFYADIETAARDGMPLVEAPKVYDKGDVNNDDKIDLTDFIIFCRHNADWFGYKNEIDFISADINFDGYVDIIDSTILARHLAGWSDYKNIQN